MALRRGDTVSFSSREDLLDNLMICDVCHSLVLSGSMDAHREWHQMDYYATKDELKALDEFREAQAMEEAV